MAKNISLLGANYPDVPAVLLPQTGGGTAMFVDPVEMRSILEWKSAGSTTTKNTDISVPVDAYELLVHIKHKLGYEFTTVIPWSNTAHYYYLGSYVTTSSVLFAEITYAGGSGKMRVSIIKFGGSDVANGDFTFELFYR